eukprot:CAMPEP_0178806934 /NCGR_PEP_ID=MMETSP0745-20121128/16631_1 /TAXON_ID=913974 /ORGANISM="Nitzschia punctata, Strain CCMP561" /LENGTH=66 /DNA_ID=CAMNT_0020466841 /DNA_START=27 /DNA_END=227 /DNA_ORIENTATION=+
MKNCCRIQRLWCLRRRVLQNGDHDAKQHEGTPGVMEAPVDAAAAAAAGRESCKRPNPSVAAWKVDF